MKNFLLISLFFILLSSTICLRKLKRLTNKELYDMDQNRERVGLIYINPKNMSHKFFMDELANYLEIKPLINYNFDYCQITWFRKKSRSRWLRDQMPVNYSPSSALSFLKKNHPAAAMAIMTTAPITTLAGPDIPGARTTPSVSRLISSSAFSLTAL